ncbi:MAG: DoxX family protein [Bacteroidales bacterium]|nr:DoxX family protein [Bacteroidales bacterium]MDE7071807.1 DoxX family protein [Bacteroidales bacterium]
MNRTSLPAWIPSYGILLLTLAAAAAIPFVPEKSLLFLGVLVLDLLFCIVNRKYFSYSVVVIVRTLVGAVFVFSGFSKGVDPLGTAYQIHDYLEAYNMPWLTGLSLLGSFALNLVEFTVGVLLICNVRFKFMVRLAALMMLFFTCVTWYDVVAEPVPDCGCFGKAWVITNWQTFYKNLVLDACVLVLLFAQNRVKSHKPPRVDLGIAVATVVLFLGFESYNYRYLPVVNFLDWKEGERLFPENPLPVAHYLTYRNQATGEEKEYLMEDCPFSDAGWLAEWTFVSRRDFDPNPKKANINILEKSEEEDPGYDITRDLLEREGFLFLIAVYDLDAADKKGLEKTAAFVRRMREAGYESCFLTASPVEKAESIRKEYDLTDFPFYYADNTAIKAIIRSNPGIVLLKSARVLKLWDWRRLPAPECVDFAAF